jgi:predicted MFS family arabinose efflux permease
MQTIPPTNTEDSMPRWMVFLFASACGLMVANLYYAQPLISLIAQEIGLNESAASLIVTLTQLGYCTGLILLVPLGDLLENRKLVVVTICGAIVALFIATLSQTTMWFLISSCLIGIGSVSVQMLLPIAANMTPEKKRGSTIGSIMSGLLLGIMLARPVSSLIADVFGWRTVFGASAVLLMVFAVILWTLLPVRKPDSKVTYFSLIGSLWMLLRNTPVLRRRALYQASLFASFTLFWTITPILLSQEPFNLTQKGIAFFAFAGAFGVVAAPIAGRLADRGHTKITTLFSLAIGAVAFLLALYAGNSGALALLVIAAMLLDLGVQSNVVLGQRTIYLLNAEVRSRLNALYMAIFFAGGAIGSGIASLAYVYGGWSLVAWIGFAFPALGLLFFFTE